MHTCNKRSRTLVLLTPILAVVAALLTVSAGANARPTPPTTSHRAGYTKTWAVLKMYDHPGGKVVYRHIYPASTRGKVLHLPKVMTPMGTATGSSNNNPINLVVHQSHKDASHIHVIWEFNVWTKWYHDLSGPGLAHVINVVDQGSHGKADDPFWTYDGLIGDNHHYYTWCCGVAHSGYYNMKQGEFSGPSLVLYLTTYDRPKTSIWSHGKSFKWDTSCC